MICKKTKNYINYLYDTQGIKYETNFSKNLKKSFSSKRTFHSSSANKKEIKQYLNYMIYELSNYLKNNLAKIVNEFNNLCIKLNNLLIKFLSFVLSSIYYKQLNY